MIGILKNSIINFDTYQKEIHNFQAQQDQKICEKEE